ncbi:amino acid ABC transporter permease [Staphylococcus gallinarum]|uniref:Amino acid ABC transporter permease n=1 Tax=Staphylococcus gallinarum TaxID=1293 RepID=A0A380FJW3_STAGA|nr:amino acid ABC transporter permease [Staphylococcus gallinarum]
MSASINWIDLFLQVVQRLPLTLGIILLSLLFSIIIGFLLAVIRINKIPFLAPIVRVYLSFIRSTPLLVQLFFSIFCITSIIIIYSY